MLDFKLQHVLSRFSGFLLPSLCLWGEAAKLIIFEGFKNKLSSRFTWQAWHLLTFSRLSSSLKKVPFAQYFFCSVFRRWVAFFVAGVRITLETSIVILHGGVRVFLRIPYEFRETGENPLRTFASKRFYLGNAKVAALGWVARNHAELNLRYKKNAAWMQLRTWHTNFVWLLHLALHHQKLINICTCGHIQICVSIFNIFNCSVLGSYAFTGSTVQALQAAMQLAVFWAAATLRWRQEEFLDRCSWGHLGAADAAIQFTSILYIYLLIYIYIYIYTPSIIINYIYI